MRLDRSSDCRFSIMPKLEELLYNAVGDASVESVIILLKQGANVNSLVESGRSVLGRAAELGHVPIIKALLNADQHRIIINPAAAASETSSYETFMPSARSAPSNYKCNVNLPDLYDRTPLHYAAENGRMDVLQLLLSSGCRIDVSDSENITPLHIAASHGHEAFMDILLLAGCQVNRKTSDKTSALHIAASRGFAAVAELLIQNGAKVDALDASERTPLLVAVNRANHDVVRVLLEHGAKANTEEIHGYTPLSEAVWLKDLELVRMLLAAGAKMTKSHHLLHYCVLYRNLQLVQLLLEAGCLVNVRDDSGDTPLHLAARAGQLPIMELLLQYGANVNYPNGLTGTSPLHESVDGLQEKDHDLFTAILRKLIEHRCRLDAETFTPGDTPLYRAILLDKFRLAAALVRHGADVHRGHVYSCNIDNLCLARRKGNFLLVKLLVYAGFDVRRTTPWLETLPTSMTNGSPANGALLQHSYSPNSLKGWLVHVKTNPLSLLDLCRCRLRLRLGEHVYPVVTTMVLPERIKRYLLLEDVDA